MVRAAAALLLRRSCCIAHAKPRARAHTHTARIPYTSRVRTLLFTLNAVATFIQLLLTRPSDAPAGKKAHAAKERDNDYLVQQAKIRDLAVKKRQHQAVFEKKYAPADMAQSWTGASTLRRGRKVTSPMS